MDEVFFSIRLRMRLNVRSSFILNIMLNLEVKNQWSSILKIFFEKVKKKLSLNYFHWDQSFRYELKLFPQRFYPRFSLAFFFHFF